MRLRFSKTAKKIVGVFCIILGILALITPLTPGSWLVFVGLEFLGLRYLFQDKTTKYLRAFRGLWKRQNSSSAPESERDSHEVRTHED